MSQYNELDAILNDASLEASDIYRHLYQSVRHLDSDLPVILDFGDSYNGSSTYPPLNLFVASILASLGYPCLVHGSAQIPKDGSMTHHQILTQANKPTGLSLEQALERLYDHDVAWAYVPQTAISPDLGKWRKDHPSGDAASKLYSLENKLQPIRGHKNYLFAQYFKDEPLLTVELLKERYDAVRVLYVKGIDGTTMLEPSQPTHCKVIENDTIKGVAVKAKDLGFDIPAAPTVGKLTPEEALNIGLLVLDAEENPMRKFIQYQCVAILHLLFDQPPQEALYDVRQAIDTGAAMMHWNSFQ